jgi:hypothetical protein
MTKAEKGEEDGRKALAYISAVTMVVCGFGEQDIQFVGVILAAKGYFTLNMGGIDSGYGSGASGPSKVSKTGWLGIQRREAQKEVGILDHSMKTHIQGCTQEPQHHDGPSGGLESD